MKIRNSLRESVLYAAIEIERFGENGTFDPVLILEAADQIDVECKRFRDGQKATPGQFFIWEPWIVSSVREFRKKPRVPNEDPVIIEAYTFLDRQSKRLRHLAATRSMTPRMRTWLVRFLLHFHQWALSEEDARGPWRRRFAA